MNNPEFSKGIAQEGKRIPVNTAKTPIEVFNIFNESGLPTNTIEGWLAVPSMSSNKEFSLKEIQVNGQVDAYEMLSPLLDNKTLKGTLRTMDVLNGCGNKCDTCFADSVLPSKMFSYDSLERLFSDDRFLEMLQPDSFRFGSSGDIINHPQAAEIIEMALQKTSKLDAKVQAESNGEDNFEIKIYTNYRPKTEEQLDEIIKLIEKYPKRIVLCISLPFNKKETVSNKFTDYIKERPKIFIKDNYPVGKDGSLDFDYVNTYSQSISIADVGHTLLFTSGRVLSKKANANRVPKWKTIEDDRDMSFCDRGMVKTYLNPDALWLMVYGTVYESHTTRAFTPITPENINLLSKLPYHSDFPAPPNWPGGRGILKSLTVGRELKKEMEKSGVPKLKPTVVK